MSLFGTIQDTWNFTRFDGWTVLIAAGEYEIYNDATGEMCPWTIDEKIAGVINVKKNPFCRVNEYMAPEVLLSYSTSAYNLFREDGSVEPGGPRTLRFLEAAGMLSFISAPVNITSPGE